MNANLANTFACKFLGNAHRRAIQSAGEVCAEGTAFLAVLKQSRLELHNKTVCKGFFLRGPLARARRGSI